MNKFDQDAKILTQAQAKAVAEAMAYLNNVGAVLHVRFLGNDTVHVKEYLTDEVNVWQGDPEGNWTGGKVERYSDQAEFLRAYDI